MGQFLSLQVSESGENRFPKEKRPSMTLVTADSKRASTESWGICLVIGFPRMVGPPQSHLCHPSLERRNQKGRPMRRMRIEQMATKVIWPTSKCPVVQLSVGQLTFPQVTTQGKIKLTQGKDIPAQRSQPLWRRDEKGSWWNLSWFDLEQIHASERLCFYPFCDLRSDRTHMRHARF